MRYPHVRQHDEKDCGAACLSMICEYYGLKLPMARFRNIIKVDKQGTNIYGLVTGAQELGLEADALEGSPEELIDSIEKEEVKFPFIARIINEDMYEHYIVVYGVKKDYFVIGDPGTENIGKMPLDKFFYYWQKQVVIFKPGESFEKKNERKGSFRKFFKYITTQKKALLCVFLVSLVVAGINIVGSVVFEYVIDDVVMVNGETMEEEEHTGHTLENENILDKLEDKLSIVFSNLETVCISIILLYVFQFFLRLIRGYSLAVLGKKVALPLTLDYYDHLIDLPINFFGTRNTGELISRFSDTDKIRETISTTTLSMMLDTIMAIACGIFLFIISHTLFIMTVIVMLLYAIVVLAFRKPIKNINHDIMEQDARVTSYLKESIDGIEEIKASGYENIAKSKTADTFGKLVDKIVKSSVIYSLQEALVVLLSSVGIVVLLWMGATLCLEDIITLGELMTFYYLLDYFLEPVKNLINLQPMLQTATVAAERLNDILDADIEKQGSIGEKLDGDIQFQNVNFRYGNRNLILKDVSLKIEKGKKVAVIGDSGCGKTTLVKLLMGFYQPEQGSITVGKQDISKLTPQAVRQNIAYISQDIFLFSDSVYNNLRMGDDSISKEEVEEVSKQCGLEEFIFSLPMGYDTMIEENGKNLSGGQKQRIAIARALLKKLPY